MQISWTLGFQNFPNMDWHQSLKTILLEISENGFVDILNICFSESTKSGFPDFLKTWSSDVYISRTLVFQNSLNMVLHIFLNIQFPEISKPRVAVFLNTWFRDLYKFGFEDFSTTGLTDFLNSWFPENMDLLFFVES